MNLDITNDNMKWLDSVQEKTGLSYDVIVNKLITNNRLRESEALNKKSEITYLPENDIFNYYKEIYQKKFSIESDEVIDFELINRIIVKIDASIEDIKITVGIVKKAIVWYIYQHDSTGKDGQRYPYRLKLLLGQNFILKSCIEASHSVDLELLLKAQSQNISQKELLSAMRRGDLAGTVAQESPTMLMEQALEKADVLIMELKLDKDFKKHPKMKGLYTSDVPSLEYTRKALKFMESLRKIYDESNI
jgi:hypothetical protein